MKWYKVLDGTYIMAAGKTEHDDLMYDHEITQAEYDTILTAVRNIPKNPPEGYRYRLDDTTKTYVLVEEEPVEPVEEDASPDEIAEALEDIV